MEPSNIKQHFQGRHCRAVQTHQDWISFIRHDSALSFTPEIKCFYLQKKPIKQYSFYKQGAI